MKKTLILSVILLLTACNVDYRVKYIDGKFTESAVISLQLDENSETMEKISGGNSGKIFKNEDDIPYNVKFSTNNKIETLELNKFYESSSFLKTRAIKCFEYSDVNESDDYYIIRLWGGIGKCQYVDTVKFTFETNMDVYQTNAHEVNIDKGKYIWNNVDDGIEIQVSKNFTKKDTEKTNTPLRFSIVLIVTAVATIIIVFKLKKDRD